MARQVLLKRTLIASATHEWTGTRDEGISSLSYHGVSVTGVGTVEVWLYHLDNDPILAGTLTNDYDTFPLKDVTQMDLVETSGNAASIAVSSYNEA